MFSSVLTIVVPKWGAPNNWMLYVQQWLLHIGEHHKNSVAHKSCQSKFFNAHVKQMQLGDTSEYVNQLCPMLFSGVLFLLGFLNTTDKNYCVHFWQMVLQPEILSHFSVPSHLQFGDTLLLIFYWTQSGKCYVKYGEHVYNWGKRLQWWSWKESPLFCVVRRCTYGSILPQSVGPFWGVMIHLPLPLRIIHWYKGFHFRRWSLKYLFSILNMAKKNKK